MRRRELGIDAAIAAAVFAALLAVVAARGFGDEAPDARGLDALGVALTAASALPLAVRRLAPAAVYAVVTAGTLVMLALGYSVDLPMAPLIALYGLADVAGGDERLTRRWGAMAAAAAFVPLTALAYGIDGEFPRLAPEMLGLAAMIAGVWLAGDRTRLRRERIVALEERARRSEREAERERRLAAAEERTRIARELHDSAGHAMNVILVQAGAARLLQERDSARASEAIATVESVARETIGEIDRLVRALRDDGSVDAPPADPALLEELVARHRAAGLAVRADVRGARDRLPRSVAWAANRILQEALANAARHGRGPATVSVDFGPAAADITVTNPAGDDRSGAPGGGHGIVGMRERATLLGGTLEAGRENGAFRLHARLPYSAP